jgi:hypothetical protein
MDKKKYSLEGQAAIEMCVCVIAIVVVFLGLIFVGGLGISNMQDLIKAKSSAEAHSRISDKAWDSDDISAWDYRSLQQQQRQTTAPDFFPGSHLFYNSRGGNINPFSNDRAIISNANTGSTNQVAPLAPADFQSSFLRELSSAKQAKQNESAANGISRDIPSLFVDSEETAGSQEPDEPAFPDMIESDGSQEKSGRNIKSFAK